jgi:holo-[acyl-carrier protein] synthase
VGTDLIAVKSVAESIRQFGDRYLERVFTPDERAYCASIDSHGGDSAPHFAARFAAKEAVIKVLRPSAHDAVGWRSIEIVRSSDGACTVRLRGAAQALARRARLRAFSVSLSHERDYATAVAVAERGRVTPPPRKSKRAHAP